MTYGILVRFHISLGNFKPLNLTGSSPDQYKEFTVSVNNLKREYSSQEEARIYVNVRPRDYRSHVGVIKSASFDIQREYIEKMYYGIFNNETGETIVPFRYIVCHTLYAVVV